jgi:peptide/nickel transport system permease protein
MEVKAEHKIQVKKHDLVSSYIEEGKKFLKRLLNNKGAAIGGLIFLIFVLIAVLCPYISPHDPSYINSEIRLLPPNDVYRMGTDGFGRDILSRMIYGARLSLLICSSVVTLSTIIGSFLGLISGYYKRVDFILMRILDGFMAFPSIILHIGIMAALGPSVRNVIMALTLSYSPRMARVVRSAVLVQKEQQYVEAAKVLGAKDLRILLVHLFPNCIAPVIIQATMIFAYAMLSEASLSFLGVGVPPEIPSWGNILSQGRVHIRRAPWITYYSGLTIAIVVLAINMFGDGLRDVLDPKLRK